jgi:hypothetical protein
MEVVASAGLTVVATGRQVGQSLAELAKSTVAGRSSNGSGEAAPAVAGLDGSGPDEPPTPVPFTPSTTAQPEAAPVAPVAVPGPPLEALEPDAPAPARPRGQAVPSWRHTDPLAPEPVATVPLRRVPVPTAMPVPVPAEPLTQTDGRKVRLYPRWWQRLRSLIVLVILMLVGGLALGAAIGYVLVTAYRFISGSL